MLEKIKENPRLVVAVLITAGVIALLIGSGSNSNNTQTENQPSQNESQSEQTVSNNDDDSSSDQSSDAEAENSDEAIGSAPIAGPVAVTKNEGIYSATVRSGDNQTVIVRQIIADYLESNELALSAEKRLFIETNLVNDLPRNDTIFAGQVVSLNDATIKTTVERSNTLTDTQLARWSAYL